MVNQPDIRPASQTPSKELLDRLAQEATGGNARLNPADPDAEMKFTAFLAEQEAQTQPEGGPFKRLFDQTVGRAAGAVGRGALGAGRFVGEGFESTLRPFGILGQEEQLVQPTLNALDQYSAASGSAAAQQVAPLFGTEQGIGGVTQLEQLRQGQPLQPNSFDAFMADLQARREAQSVIDALTLRADREAFRESAIPAKPVFEAVGDVTNLIPGAALARPLRLAGRAGARAVPEVAQQAGAATARELGEAAAARSAQRAARAPEVVPFGPNRTAEGVPAGIPEGAGINFNDPEEVANRIDEITNELEVRGRSLIRPQQPWARRMTNAQLEALARHEGLDPSRQDWWDGIDPVVIREVRESGQPANVKTIPELQRERNMLRRVQQDLETQPVPAGVAEDVVELDLATGRVTPVGARAAAPDTREPFFSYSITQPQRAEHEDLYRRFLAGEEGFETSATPGAGDSDFTVVRYQGRPVFDLMEQTPSPVAAAETPPVTGAVDELEAEVAAVRNRLQQSGIPPRQARRALTPEEELEAEVSALRGGAPPPGGGGGTGGRGVPPGGAQPEGTKRVIDLIRISKRLRPTVEEEIAAQRQEGVRIGRERAETATTPLGRSRAFLSGQAGRTTSQRRFEPIAQRAGDEGGNLSEMTPTQASEALGVTADDFNGMFQQIENVMGRGREFDASDAQAGLIRLLLGNTATPREARLLEQVFGREMAEATRSRVPLSVLRKAGDLALDIGFLLPKTVRSSWDASAPLRQAVIYTVNPRPSRLKITFESLADMIRVGFARPGEAEKTARDIYQRIVDPAQNRWAETLYQTGPEKTRLFLQNPEQPLLDFTQREEFFASDLASKLPSLGKDFRSIRGRRVPRPVSAAVSVATLPVRVVGSGVRRAELMFATYLNEVRNAVATNVLDGWQRTAVKTGRPITQAEVEELRRGINIFTGRGELGPLDNIAKLLSAGFWSPRLLASRIEAPFFPLRGFLNPEVSRASAELAKDLVAFTLTGTTILYLINASKFGRVELDPRSPNFGKIKVGSTTYDFWGGFQQPVRYVAQIISGQRKTITGEEEGEIAGVRRVDVLANFLRSKASPGVPTLAGNELFGRTFDQEPISNLSQARQREIAFGRADSPNEIRLREAYEQYVPLFAKQLEEAVQESGARSLYQTLPEGLGVGVQRLEEEDRPAR